MSSCVRILHLSDLHFGASERQHTITQALACDVRRMSASVGKPDLIAITGDIAHDGRKESYDLAKKWLLNDLEPSAPVFLVPGNHDANYSTLTVGAQKMQEEALCDSPSGPSSEHLELLLDGHREFFRFAQEIENNSIARSVWTDLAQPPKFPEGSRWAGLQPWWARRGGVGDFSVQLIGVWSSWMCSRHDKWGDLLIGERQLDELLAPHDQSDLTIALIHHPWEYFRDRDIARRRLWEHCDLILRGHLHMGRAYAVETPDYACVELEAGAAGADRDRPNGYEVIEFFPYSRKVTVHYRRWDGTSWAEDNDCYKSAKDGMVHLYLRSSGTSSSDVLKVSERYSYTGRHIRILSWNKTHANSFSEQLLTRLTDAISSAPRNTILILMGSATHFSSGLERDEMRATRTPAKLLDRLMQLFNAMCFRAPIVSVVRGPASAGGAGVAFFSHLVVACNTARFSVPGKRYYRKLARILVPVVRRRRTWEDPWVDKLLDENFTRDLPDLIYDAKTAHEKKLVDHYARSSANNESGLIQEAVTFLEEDYFLSEAWDRVRQATTDDYAQYLTAHLESK